MIIGDLKDTMLGSLGDVNCLYGDGKRARKPVETRIIRQVQRLYILLRRREEMLTL